MNADDVLRYGHLTVITTLQAVPDDRWEEPGVCGVWSVKQIIAHLASYERALDELLGQFLRGTPEAFASPFSAGFNDEQVARRDHLRPAAIRAEYEQTAAQVLELIPRIDAAQVRQPGLLPWYGPEYALDDFLVYSYYGHKREHSAQIDVLTDRLRRSS
jgi:uncharacterized protein (TIGR03083 family)